MACPNSDTPCSEISFLAQLTMQISYACIYVHVQACRLCDDSSQYGLRSHMLLPKYRSGNPLSSNFHDFLKQSHEKLFHLQQLHAISVLVSFTVFVKFVRNAVGCTVMIFEICRYTCVYMGLYGVLYLVKRSTGNDHKIA